MTSDPARQYFLSRALYRLTQKAVQETNLCVSKGPLAPLTEMQNVALRVALGSILREAIAAGRWYERQKNGPPPPPATTRDNPRFDDDVTTEPMRPRR